MFYNESTYNYDTDALANYYLTAAKWDYASAPSRFNTDTIIMFV